MRVAVLILGLLLGLLMFLQTLLVYGLSNAIEDESRATAGAVGIMMAFLWLAACAFVLPFPMVSVVCFAVAALFGFAVSGDFPDLGIWGGVAVFLGVLSLLGWFGKRKERRREHLKEQTQAEQHARYEALLAQQQRQHPVIDVVAHEQRPRAALATRALSCTNCGHPNTVGTKFCAECGVPQAIPALSVS